MVDFYNILAGIIPVFVFLVLLTGFDSFKLIRTNDLIFSFILGLIAALLALLINNLIQHQFDITYYELSVRVAPPTEEIIKTVFFIHFVYWARVGFMIDGAILGFAIGASFAAIENTIFLYAEPHHSFIVYLVRGVGTAIMHGGVTALSALIAMYFVTKFDKINIRYFLPGLIVAIAIHLLYNQFFISPVHSSIVIVFLMPALIYTVFYFNERSLSRWLDMEFDEEVNLLQKLKHGEFTDTRQGKYMTKLKDQFKPDIVYDMICYLQIYLELSIQAKSFIMQKEQGLSPIIDDNTIDKIDELDHLKKSIGRSGAMALSPILPMRQKDIWKINMLRENQ
jgi:RsiW-degrading membrane proteinase PrsW (M82 family)